MKEVIELIKESFSEWQEDKASRLAAALALYAILSIPPLLILSVSIAGQIIEESVARETLISQVGRFLGSETRDTMATILEAATQPEGVTLASLISIGVLFFSASGVFVQLQDAMNTIWDVMPEPDQGIMRTIKKRAMSFLMVMGIGILLIILLAVNSIVAFLDRFLREIIQVPLTWGQILNYSLSFLILVGIIALLFKVIPDVQIQWRDVMVGSFVTSLLIALGVVGISIYLSYSDPTSSYGSAGSLVVLLLWVYYSCQILFLGAEFTQVYASRYGKRIIPDEDAVFIPGKGEQEMVKE